MKAENSFFGNRLVHLSLLLCVSVMMTLLLVEVVLRVLPGITPGYGLYVWPPHMTRIFEPAPDVMPGVSGQSRFIINSIGLRGDDLLSNHTYRVLTVGGSTTECLYLDQSETWPYLLQNELNHNMRDRVVWVGSAGMSGRNAYHHWVLIRDFPLRELQIDVVVFLLGVNDLSRRLNREGDYEPKFLDYVSAELEYFDETFMGTTQLYPDGPFYKKSQVWRLLRNAKHVLFNDNYQDDAGRVYVDWRKSRENAIEIRGDIPDLSSGIEEYIYIINKIIDIGESRQIRLIFLTQPSMWREDLGEDLSALLWFGHISNARKERGNAYYSAGALEKSMNAYNLAAIRLFEERDIEYLDLASMLEKNTNVFYDDVHFNENGARLVAERLSKYMLEKPPFVD